MAQRRSYASTQKPKIPESLIKAKEVDLQIKNRSNNIKMQDAMHNSPGSLSSAIVESESESDALCVFLGSQ